MPVCSSCFCSFYAADPSLPSAPQIAFASTCARDQYDRPIAGVLTFVPSFLAGNAAALSAASAWAATPAGAAAVANPDATSSVPSFSAATALLRGLMAPNGGNPGKQLLYVTMHEIAHALGFSASSIPLFRDGATGLPRARRAGGAAFGLPEGGRVLPATMLALPSERGHAGCGTPGGACVFKLRTPAASAAASRHFGCPPETLLGPELENEEAETSGAIELPTANVSYGSHWEQRLFASELMAPVLQFDDMFVSETTLGFFEDSGWYYPDYAAAIATSSAPGVRFGLRQGCAFATKECLRLRTGPAADASFAATPPGDAAALADAVVPAGSPAHYCSARRAPQCTFDLRDKGTCDITSMGSSAATTPYYAYFRNVPFATGAQRTLGGSLPHADFCPLVVPQVSCSADPGGADVSFAGEVYGATSRCVMGTLAPAARVNGTGGVARAVAAPACYATACSADGLTLTLSARSADGAVRRVACLAAQEGVALPVPGFAGTVTCPPAWAVCGRTPEPCAATSASYGLSGTTLALGLAAAAAAGVATLLYTPSRLMLAWESGAAAREEARREAAEQARAQQAAVEAEAEAMRVALAFRGGDGRQTAQQQHAPQAAVVPAAAAPSAGAWGDAEAQTPPQRVWRDRGDFDGDDDDAAPHAHASREASAYDHEAPDDDVAVAPPGAASPQPPPAVPLLARAAALRAPGCFPLLAQDAPGPLAVLSRSHPAAVLCRSVGYALSRGARDLQAGAPVQAQMYEQTRGWGAASITLRLSDSGGSTRPLPPPLPLPPGAGWAPRLGRQRHPASFAVSRVAADSRGAPLYMLQSYDFDAPGGAARALQVQRLWGGAAGPPPPLPAGLGDGMEDAAETVPAPAPPPPPRYASDGGNAFSAPNAEDAFRAMGSAGTAVPGGGSAYGGASGAYAGGYGSGVSAAAAEAVTGWTPWFYREQLHAPPLAAVPPERRPPAALRAGLGGAPLRRILALAVLYGPVTLLLVALEASLRGAALQSRCAPAWRLIVARGASAGVLTSTFSYTAAYLARNAPHLGIEMLPRSAFWPPLGVCAAGALAAAAWAVSATYTAASGGLPLPMGPAATAPPGADALAGLCADPAGPVACAEAALRRVGIAWGAALAGDAFLFTPLLLLASAYVWRDDVAVDTLAAHAKRKQAAVAEDGAWGAAPAEVQMAPRATQLPPSPQRLQQREDAAGAWGGNGGGGGGGAWGDDSEAAPPARTWQNPTYDDAAPSAPPLPPLTRGAALRAETTGAWG